jgi:hemoglobin
MKTGPSGFCNHPLSAAGFLAFPPQIFQEVHLMSLYERLGGVFAIATIVDDFIDQVMSDSRLNLNSAVNEAHHRVPPAGFKYLVTEQLCEATGGPQRYTGRSMSDSNAHLKITDQEWKYFPDDLRITLNKFSVPDQEQSEIFAIVESTRDDIVTS